MSQEARHTSLPVFALDLYAGDGIASRCLSWQDDLGVDVTVLLMAAWAGARGRVLSLEDVAQACSGIEPWRTQVVAPLRQMRRRLKAALGPVSVEDATALRETIKAAELESEMIALRTLAACCPSGRTGVGRDEALRSNIAAVMRRYSANAAAAPQDIEAFVSAALAVRIDVERS
jgi:uncharacterized protein (TIGR02444 family)